MARKHVNLGRAPDKRDLPQKTCVVCGKPFSWRRKWARDWDQVKVCSDRCRAAGAESGRDPHCPRPTGGVRNARCNAGSSLALEAKAPSLRAFLNDLDSWRTAASRIDAPRFGTNPIWNTEGLPYMPDLTKP